MLRCEPLKDRVFISRSKASSSITYKYCRQDVFRPGTYKDWDEERMDRAVKAVLDGSSIRKAALDYGVPKSTLGDRISGRVLPGAVSGPTKYLSTEEEGDLAHFVCACASIGYPKTRKDVLSTVQRVLSSRGMEATITNGWWESFCRRHPNLTLRTSTPLSSARAAVSDPAVFDRYFDLLEETLQANKLIDKPGQIFNIDETGFPLAPKPPKTIQKRGVKNPVAVTSGDKSQITVVGCVNALGMCFPPMIIYDRLTLNPELTECEVPGTIYGLSRKGWIDQELFDLWFSRLFLRHAPMARPLLLLFDGHSSHYCPDTIRMAADHQVILFALPPHTTHLSQPLDKGCFAPLKQCWREVCHKYQSQNPGKVVNRYNFSRLFHEAWTTAMTARNILSGFRVSGIVPLNRDAICLPCQKESPSLQVKSGLAFIPLCSPAQSRKKSRLPIFTEDELELFETRFDNGYDLLHDHRYNEWLQLYHPEKCSVQESALVSSPTSPSLSPPPDEYIPIPSSSSISKFLTYPSPPPNPKPVEERSSARVLTSSENLDMIKEKELQKLEKTRLKEERKRMRQEKAAMKKQQIEQKRQAREKKKGMSTTYRRGKYCW